MRFKATGIRRSATKSQETRWAYLEVARLEKQRAMDENLKPASSRDERI